MKPEPNKHLELTGHEKHKNQRRKHAQGELQDRMNLALALVLLLLGALMCMGLYLDVMS